ncbi:MAG TPA: penicillin acylase family protein [Candidatus Heimdallarchaeota archaeon]|nr:penicillin acylase family protein [Candidatus Heimdallarchaeota archaeon]
MRTLKKILVALLILLGIGLIIGILYVRQLSRKGLPDYNAEVKLEGMLGQVTVYRDAYAVPHIYADNEKDLYRATGYVMAQDRLWQMDLFRRATTGRLSEIFGPDLVEADLLMRALRIPEKSRMVLSRQEPEVLETLEAFADGVNQFIEIHQDDLPLEFSLLGYKPEDWAPEHTVNLISYMAWDLTFPWRSETLLFKIAQKIGPDNPKLIELIPDLSLQTTLGYPKFRLEKDKLELSSNLLESSRKLEQLGLVVFSGSNNWAVSGKKSITGKPLFANDMHLDLFIPGIWYQMHQIVEGKLNVTGVCLAGAPSVVAGHNQRIAWGMTNAMVDDMDFYLETIHPENPNMYMFNGEWREMDVRTERILIKGSEIAEKTLRFTHRGPIISGFKGISDHALSMRWIGNEFSDEVYSVYWLNRAGNWEEFKQAAKYFFSVSQNINYADVDGNIGLYYCAGVPIRKGKGFFVFPGETDEYDWTGFIPFEELPHVYNPESGYVSSANNRATDETYPYYISQWFLPPHRIERIHEMLEAKEKLSIDDFKSMHSDLHSTLVDDILGDIVGELKDMEDLSTAEKKALELLMSWPGELTEASAATSIFEKMQYHLTKNLIQDELGDELLGEILGNRTLYLNLLVKIFRTKESLWCDDVSRADSEEDFSQVVQKSFRDTVQDLVTNRGEDPEDWEWGKIHKLHLDHPIGSVKILDRVFRLNRGPFPVGGSNHTVCPFSYSFKTFVSKSGASHRHIYSLANWDESWTVIPTGVSGVPASPHYCDQTSLYLKNQYHHDYINRNLIERSAFYVTKIK